MTSPIPSPTFDEIMFTLRELKDKLTRSHDPAEKRTLLTKFTRLLNQAEKLNEARLRETMLS